MSNATILSPDVEIVTDRKTSVDVIQVENLVKYYPGVKAVDGVSFSVAGGEIFGLLGPNGAGKTTTTEIIEGLRQPDSGTVRVLGQDMHHHADAVKQRIGVQLQTTALYQKLTVREIVALFGSFFDHALPPDEAIALVDLQEKAGTRSKQLSGGQRQRLAVAIALVNDPEVIFLDEPTTGLDPQARRRMWEVIENLRARGRTIFLTTHAMEEAERLCDRVAIMDHGTIIALGSPQELIDQHFTATAITFPTPVSIAQDELRALPCVERVGVEQGTITLYSSGVAQTIAALSRIAAMRNEGLNGLTVQQATLEDVFLKLTGRRIRE
ncbi:MAG TPA: ABC transporter ATP-binding protein [Roseiflexaceae bacterium]|nr:ABC transporter ATP-binding protein [Roseiflexaceae bacterium]